MFRQLDEAGAAREDDAAPSLEERLLRLVLAFPVDCVLTEEPRALAHDVLRGRGPPAPAAARAALAGLGSALAGAK